MGSSVKYDPAEPDLYPPDYILNKFEDLRHRTWDNPLGDGEASRRISEDLLARLKEDNFRHHRPSDYHLDIRRSYRDDGLSKLI